MGAAFKRLLGGDSTLLVVAAAIILSSVWLLDTAIVAPGGGVQHDFAYRQVAFAMIGIAIAFGVSRIPLVWWQQWWPHALALAIAGVVAVRFVGTVVNGSRRWIDLGPIALQPSEFGKFLALIAVTGFLAGRAREVRSGRVFATVLAMMAVPAAVVFLQPDFGTAQVYGYLSLGVLFFAGARWVHFAMLGGTVVALLVLVLGLLPAVGLTVLHDYQVKRLTGFLDPEADAQGSNYQTIQAKIAIGSGQLAGRPSDEASQVQQGFLPEPQTDFIFATLVERTGFIGGAFVLGLYLLLLSRILAAVGTATSYYGRLVAGGVATLFFAQVCVNVGMVVGVLPVTGVPLPMFSYGGSSLWTNMALLGLVAAVLREAERPEERYRRRTGRPVGGFGSLRATGSERAAAGSRAPRGASLAGSPLTGGAASRARRRLRR
ncbi:MAG: rod shape-determining protein RodA [Thermoleophilia bacterium]|nr:rod shape-determining protein RodA [Thermoleophilia bacterium]